MLPCRAREKTICDLDFAVLGRAVFNEVQCVCMHVDFASNRMILVDHRERESARFQRPNQMLRLYHLHSKGALHLGLGNAREDAKAALPLYC